MQQLEEKLRKIELEAKRRASEKPKVVIAKKEGSGKVMERTTSLSIHMSAGNTQFSPS